MQAIKMPQFYYLNLHLYSIKPHIISIKTNYQYDIYVVRFVVELTKKSVGVIFISLKFKENIKLSYNNYYVITAKSFLRSSTLRIVTNYFCRHQNIAFRLKFILKHDILNSLFCFLLSKTTLLKSICF